MLIKILIVDDSASDRLIINKMLSEYSILTACDGVEALRMLAEHEDINLLILDLNMPNMNGFQVLEALKQNERLKKLRTIILTNYDEQDNEIKGLRLGAVDYIRKPIQIDSLRARIDVHAALMRAEHVLKEQLKDQTLSLDVIFEQAPIGIMIMHSNATQHSNERIIRINSMYEQITGRKKEELMNSGWTMFTHPDDIEECMDHFRKLQAGEIQQYSIKKRFIKPDGSIVWVDMIVAAFARRGENLFDYICLIKDITNQKAAEDALIESERKYRSITENMSDVVWHMNLALETTYVSPSVEKLLGESPQEHMKRTLEERFPEQELRKIKSVLFEEFENEKDPQIDRNRSRTLEVEHYKADGTLIWIEMNISFIRDANGIAVGFQGSSRNVTKRKLAELALKESERSKSVLLSNLPGMACRCSYDRDWTMQFVSAGSLALTGYAPESLVNSKDVVFNEIIAPEYREMLWNEWTHAIASREPVKYELEIITATGQRKWVLVMGQGVYDENGEVEALEGILLDISDRKKAEDRLKHNYEHDSDTGLYNNIVLCNYAIDYHKNASMKSAIILINLSAVQHLSMVYGFSYARDLIRNIANILKQYSTEKCILFRSYESRFVYYITDYSNKDELWEFSQKIKAALWEVLKAERVGAGIGILEIDGAEELDLSRLSRNALIASSKAISVDENEIGIFFYDREIEAQIQRGEDIKRELTNIAENKDGGLLYLQFQPIIDLAANRICSFEALARLKTSKLGFIPPLEFIPIAEMTKLIIPIGWIIIRQAFAFQKKLESLGFDKTRVAINVSVIQLCMKDFAKHLLDMMDEMQVAPSNIEIELTESVFASDLAEINKILAELRCHGIKISIDDFGTGYSSLAREHALEVDCLKIDKCFIDQLIDADQNKAITSDIISMVHKNGHFTIAEGVEQESQLKYLKEHSCDMIQGYLISKPLVEKDALDFLKRYKTNVPVASL